MSPESRDTTIKPNLRKLFYHLRRRRMKETKEKMSHENEMLHGVEMQPGIIASPQSRPTFR